MIYSEDILLPFFNVFQLYYYLLIPGIIREIMFKTDYKEFDLKPICNLKKLISTQNLFFN
ncbi:MAG: hypothetical protein RIR48_2221 [Bacteroidota bacterium]|jgi:hypothetical protein